MVDNTSELLIEWYKPDKKILCQIKELYQYLVVETCYKEYNLSHNIKTNRPMKPVFMMPPDFQMIVRQKLNASNKDDSWRFIEADEKDGDIKICYAQLNEDIIGFVMIDISRYKHGIDGVEIVGMYVKPQYRNGFISYRLNKDVEQYCKDKGKRYI